MLLDEARRAGADVREETGVRQIDCLRDGEVRLTLDNGQQLCARYLLDASGSACVVGRHLNTRRPIADPSLHKVAYFAHFKNVERLAGREAGHPSIIMATEGWFWLIPINAETTSVGFVCHPDFPRKLTVPPQQLLAWAVARCPVVRMRMQNAVGPATNQVISDFSYTCKPYAGSGYFLIGDAACFLDPIFSTGVTLAMMSAKCATEQVRGLLRGELSHAAARRRYIRFVAGSTKIYWHLIRGYYTHSFRELFLNGEGPFDIHRAVISTLAGQVFPKPPFCLRWRLWVFDLCMFINQFRPMVPPRRPFSLIDHG
jgi:flavin-dependent dehydrogenase